MLFDLATNDTNSSFSQQLQRDNFSSQLSAKNPTDDSILVIAHDLEEATVHGLVQYMIDESRKHKFEPVTLGECLGDPKNNWYRDSKTGAELGGPAPKRPQVPAGDSGSASSSPSTPPSTSLASGTVPSASPGNPPKSSGGSGSSSSSPASPAATGTPKPSFAGRNISNTFGYAFLWLTILTLSL